MRLTEFGHLLIDEFGVSLRKRRRRILVVSKEGKEEVPLKSVREVVISGRASVTSELIKVLALSGIDMLFLSPSGRPLARLVGTKLGGTARNRYEQYRSVEDERGVEIAKALIAGKLRNQMSNMRYYSKARRMSEEDSAMLYDAYLEIKDKLDNLLKVSGSSVEEVRGEILKLEGEAAKVYWDTMQVVAGRWGFEGRERRASDIFNICLNMAYNMLSGQVWKYVLRFGLDPFLGYVHVERPGRLSLVYDLMEPYRPLVDRFVVSFLRSLDEHLLSAGVTSIAPRLRDEFYELMSKRAVEYRGRKLRVETSMFYLVQDLVSYLRGGGDRLATPYLPW